MFWIKKLIIVFISPLGLLLTLLVVGLLLSWRNIAGGWPRRIIIASTLGLVLVSTGPMGELLLAPLERGHEPLIDPTTVAGATHVVVLGGGYIHRPKGPVTAELTPASTVRLNEGIRIHGLLEDSTLVVSGAAVGQPGSTAEAMAELAVDLGVPKEEIAVADTPRDTGEEALIVRDMTEGDDHRVIVVTSASHMTRSLRLFERAGVDAVAAPTHHLTTGSVFRLGNLWPAARNVRRVERAIYEYVALIWIALGGS